MITVLQTRHSKRRNSDGFLSLEAIFALTLLIFVFFSMLEISRVLLMQLRAEDLAMTLALQARQQITAAGTSLHQAIGQRGNAIIHWSSTDVSARVELRVPGSMFSPIVTAARTLPREV